MEKRSSIVDYSFKNQYRKWKNYINRSAAGAADKEKLHIQRLAEYLIKHLLSRGIVNVTLPADRICRILHAGKKQENSQEGKYSIAPYVSGAVNKEKQPTVSKAGYLIRHRLLKEYVNATRQVSPICRTRLAGKNRRYSYVYV